MPEKGKAIYKIRESVSFSRIFQVFVLIFGAAFFGFSLFAGYGNINADVLPEEPFFEEFPAESQTKDYSKFTHTNQFHSRLPCLLCHRRDDNSSRIRFPGKTDHLPCAGCHALQFSDQSSPICTICHTNPQSGAMKRFPSLRSFGFKFDHSRHRNTNCAVCHKPESRGVVKSIPSGPSAHATCFQCHTSNSASSMASCNVCHQPGRLVRSPERTRAIRIGFSHAKHAVSFDCDTCHTVRPGSARGRQVTEPLVSMHFASENSLSCATCHDGEAVFGANDFANCKRCHIGKNFAF
ncbi:MAG TPA: hypothetical protein DEA22_06330 [Blastocatellia bacterium]|nr:hypothetical protein [Blastocatellia bacterium]